MKEGRILLLLLLIVLITPSTVAETLVIPLTDSTYRWYNFFSIFRPHIDGKLGGRNVTLLYDFDKLMFEYDSHPVWPDYDSHVVVGWAIYTPEVYYSVACEDLREQAEDYRHKKDFGYMGLPSRPFLPPIGPTAFPTWDFSIFNDQAHLVNPPHGCVPVANHKAYQVSAANKGRFTVDIPSPRPRDDQNEYVVVAAMFAHQHGRISHTFSTNMWVMDMFVGRSDFCGQYKKYNPIIKLSDIEWHEHCATYNQGICNFEMRTCVDPCEGCSGTDRCIVKNLMPAQIAELMEKTGETNFCLPAKDYCSHVSDCTSISSVRSSNDINDEILSKLVYNWDSIGTGGRCEKTDTGVEKLDLVNEIISREYGSQFKMGVCVSGAVVEEDCFHTVGNPAGYKIVSTDQGFYVGRTWGVNQKGECILGMCASPADCAVQVNTEKGTVTLSGLCRATDLITDLECDPTKQQNCIGVCEKPIEPADGWGTCTTHSGCVCPENDVPTCVKTREGYGVCTCGGTTGDGVLTGMCQSILWCYINQKTSLPACHNWDCGEDGRCLAVEHDFVCEQDSECHIDGYLGRFCNTETGCCVSSTFKDRVERRPIVIIPDDSTTDLLGNMAYYIIIIGLVGVVIAAFFIIAYNEGWVTW